MKSSREPGPTPSDGSEPSSMPVAVPESAVSPGGGGSSLGAFFAQPALRARAAAIAAAFQGVALILRSPSLREDRTPGGVRSIEGGGDPPLVAAGEVDLPDARPAGAALAGAEELKDAAVGRPARRLVLPAVGQKPLARAVRAHHPDP